MRLFAANTARSSRTGDELQRLPLASSRQDGDNSLVSGVLRFGVGKLEATVSTLTKRNDRRKLNRCSAGT